MSPHSRSCHGVTNPHPACPSALVGVSVCLWGNCYWEGKPGRIENAVPPQAVLPTPILWIIISLLCQESNGNKLALSLSRRFWLNCGKYSTLEAFFVGMNLFLFSKSPWSEPSLLRPLLLDRPLSSLALICRPFIMKPFRESWA